MVKQYIPHHKENKMQNEGNTKLARANYYDKPSNNIYLLLKARYEWMNHYIKENDIGIEVGCGTGVGKDFIRNSNFNITDYADNDWLDVKNIDATQTPFKDNSFDFIISNNMIHHLYSPIKFFQEANRILKPNGVLIIQEINASFMMRLILRIMSHEGYNFDINVFDQNIICNDPNDLWSANCAIPNLLFDNRSKFENNIKSFKIINHNYNEFFCFLNSGGVIAKTFYLPLPKIIIKFLQKIDFAIANIFPKFFALQRSLVLQKISN